ncbi:hypothetical protein [Phyllobacterium sp. SB3]|uniref:hypothetical protein n=1 Tax=Phyllobacterium sp. SB3 TaxID=3156073 RepID=UPI0032AF6234
MGFGLDNVPRTPLCDIDLPNGVAPLIYHGSSRSSNLPNQWIALRLSDLVNFQKKEVRFNSREHLCNSYRIGFGSEIILSGVDHDHRIEPWWALGTERFTIIQKLVHLGIRLVSSPNFSLLLDNPRTDDMHAIKRIGLIFSEFQHVGLSCALHPNGRTNKDFERWGKFISERPEIQVLAYEFITGPARKERMQFHLDSLAHLATKAGRTLDIVVRGDPSVIPFLRRFYRSVVYIDTTAFMKTIKRQVAERTNNQTLDWKPKKTHPEESLANHLEYNINEQVAFLKAAFYNEAI